MAANPKRALERMLGLWARGCPDPKTTDTGPEAEAAREMITSLINDGLGWLSWRKKVAGVERVFTRYAGDGNFSYCGAGLAWAYADSVALPLRRKFFASTIRLAGRGPHGPLPPGVLQRLEYRDARPGDIGIIGRAIPAGDHITMLVAPSPGSCMDVSCNGEGKFSDGSWGEGVVIRVRQPSEYTHVYRLL